MFPCMGVSADLSGLPKASVGPHLAILRRFTGLVAFPFDRLKCAMEWGGWSLSDGLQAGQARRHNGPV